MALLRLVPGPLPYWADDEDLCQAATQETYLPVQSGAKVHTKKKKEFLCIHISRWSPRGVGKLIPSSVAGLAQTKGKF